MATRSGGDNYGPSGGLWGGSREPYGPGPNASGPATSPIFNPVVSRPDPSHAKSERTDQGPTVTSEVKNIAGQWVLITYENGKSVAATPLDPSDPRVPRTDVGVGARGGGGGGIGGGYGQTPMTAYEEAQIALDKQKLADAEAQQKADEAYRQAQALDAFNKQWQDYQTKNYYGSFYGPAAAAPAGSPYAYKLPEPDFVENYYKSHPNAGPDPFSQPIPFSGYSGSGYLNPQQTGVQNAGAIPAGAVPAPISGAQPMQPFSGVSQGQAAPFNPNAPIAGQNVPAMGQQPPTGGMTAQPMGASGLDPTILQALQSHPAANQFVLSLPGASDFVAKAMGQSGGNIATPTPGGVNG